MLNVFNYNNQKITFNIGNGEVMVNATEMAKPFNKLVKDFLKIESTISFLQMLDNQRKDNSPNVDYQNVNPIEPTATQLASHFPDFIKVSKGGNIAKAPQGTWFHEDLALEFARWLNPLFGKWCNDRIKELMKHGFTATQPTMDELIANPDIIIQMATQLKKERQEKEQINHELGKALSDLQFKEQVLEESLPKLEYHDRVLRSTSLVTTTEVAKSLGTNAVHLNRKLNEWKVIYRHNDTWLPYRKYENQGLGKIVVYPYLDRSSGEIKTNRSWKWTEKGVKFITGFWNVHNQ